MPNKDEHIKQAETNQNLYDKLKTTGNDNQWAATVAFYVAVHYVEAFMATKKIHNQTHERRKQAIRTHCQGIFKTYRSLETYSKNCRYECFCPTRADMEEIQRKFDQVKRFFQDKFS